MLDGPGDLLGEVDGQDARHNAHAQCRGDKVQVIVAHGENDRIGDGQEVLQAVLLGYGGDHMVLLPADFHGLIATVPIGANELRIKVAVDQAVFPVQHHQLCAADAQAVFHRGDHVVHRQGDDHHHRSAGYAGGVHNGDHLLGGVDALLLHAGGGEHLHHQPLAEQAAPEVRVVIPEGIEGVEVIVKGIQPIGKHVLVVQVHQHGLGDRVGDGHQGVDGAVNLDLRGAILRGALRDGLQVPLDPVVVEQGDAGLLGGVDERIHRLCASLQRHGDAAEGFPALVLDKGAVGIAQDQQQRQQRNDKVADDAAAQG